MNLIKTDLHLHTLVSDGEDDLTAMLQAAREAGLEKISITDHDALGAYFNFGPDAFAQARQMGLELISGIELDSCYREMDTHLLGYGFDLHDKKIRFHLDEVQKKRKQKVAEQIEAINDHFQEEVLRTEEIFLPRRDTLMSPHLIHKLIEKELVPGAYQDVQGWLKKNIRVQTVVPPLPIAAGIRLIQAAGGRAVLAHPGFLRKENGLDLERMLAELKALGLDGLEVEYPYLIADDSPFESVEDVKEMIDWLRALAQRFGLWPTRGSDAHNTGRIKEFAQLCFRD